MLCDSWLYKLKVRVYIPFNLVQTPWTDLLFTCRAKIWRHPCSNRWDSISCALHVSVFSTSAGSAWFVLIEETWLCIRDPGKASLSDLVTTAMQHAEPETPWWKASTQSTELTGQPDFRSEAIWNYRRVQSVFYVYCNVNARPEWRHSYCWGQGDVSLTTVLACASVCKHRNNPALWTTKSTVIIFGVCLRPNALKWPQRWPYCDLDLQPDHTGVVNVF